MPRGAILWRGVCVCAAGAPGRRNHCATDSKLTSFGLFQDMAALIISSPTYEQQPVFVWSESWLDDSVSHIGLPNRCADAHTSCACWRACMHDVCVTVCA